jgi:hypothetical protein
MLRPIVLGLILYMIKGVAAQAQSLAPAGSDPRFLVGSTGGLHMRQGPSATIGEQTLSPKVHLGPTGKPCLGVSGSARPQSINRSIFYHLIFITNACSQPIKFQVCYFGTTNCKSMDVAGYGRQETLLGIMPAMRDFRYQYREQFQ